MTWRLAVLVAVLVAGCGDGQRATGEWTDEVNAICRESNERGKEIAQEVLREFGSRQDAAAAVIERSAGAQRDLLPELGRVDVPGDVRAGYEAYLEGVGDAIALAPRLADGVREGRDDPALTRRLAEITARTRPFAAEHGLGDCVTGGAG